MQSDDAVNRVSKADAPTLDVSIHTVNARGNIMLEVARDYLKLSSEHMRREIAGLQREVTALLVAKGIRYAELRSALVPQADRKEIALFFDSTQMGSFYGGEAHALLLPLLHRQSSRSVLCGDLIGRGLSQDDLYDLMVETVIPLKEFTYRHSSQFFVIYVNNLTDGMIQTILDGLGDHQAFIGVADMTYGSRLKWLLAHSLVNSYIQHKGVIIGPHEDDRPDTENVNLPGYPFEENGFRVRSVPARLEGTMLSYKIECPVFRGFEVDSEMALNAISTDILSLTELDIEIDQRKLEYLHKEKADSLRGAGLWGADVDRLKSLIKGRLSANYIYGMSYVGEHDTAKFNVMIEAEGPNGPFRILVALAYEAEHKRIRLVTLF